MKDVFIPSKRLKLCPLEKTLIMNIFMEKNHAENVYQKLVPDPLFYFGKQHKTAIACKKFF